MRQRMLLEFHEWATCSSSGIGHWWEGNSRQHRWYGQSHGGGKAEGVREEQPWVLLGWREGSMEGTERNKVGGPFVPGQEEGRGVRGVLFVCLESFLLWYP